MTEARTKPADRAAELRLAFDQSFAVAAATDATPTEDLIAIRAGSEACAMRLSEISALFADKIISPLPGGDATLLGIAGFRGRILPVYSLAALLGNAAGVKPRLLAVVAGAQIAVAFERFEGHMRAPRDSIVSREAPSDARSHVRDFVHAADAIRPIIQLASIVEFIRRYTPDAAARKE